MNMRNVIAIKSIDLKKDVDSEMIIYSFIEESWNQYS